MPARVVDLTLTAETGAVPKPTPNDVVVVGSSAAEPEKGYANAVGYVSSPDVADDHPENDAVQVASESLATMGTSRWYVTVAQELSTTESIGDAAEVQVVENLPIHDGSDVEVSVGGGTLKETVFTTLDDLSQSTPDTDTALVNTNTGEVLTDESTGSVEITYTHLDWAPVLEDMESTGGDLLFFADKELDRSSIGNLSELVTWAGAYDAIVIGQSVNGTGEPTEQAAMDIAHEVGGYVPTKDYAQIAHKSAADVAAHVVGQLSVNDPWFDPFWDGDGYPFNTDYYGRSKIGDPGTTGTFEGGDDNGGGPTNVIMSVDGVTVLSNSLTTAGAASNYQFIDIGRTESFIAGEIEAALVGLRLRRDQIPYTSEGRSSIIGAIQGRLQEYVGGTGTPLSEMGIEAPAIEDISTGDKANRLFPNIKVNGTLAGNVHEFGVELTIQV